MSKILRYTTETVSKYWDFESYRIFTLKMNSSGNLILISSNCTNSRLYSISENCIGKSLYEIMEKEHADKWHERFYEWKKSELTSYMAYFEDSSIGWDTTIEIINDTVFGIGKKVTSDQFNLATYEKHEFFNHYFIHQEDFIIITLSAQLENDFFIVESIDSSFCFNSTHFIGEDISSMMFYCSNIHDKKVYKKCLQTKKTIHYVEKYIKDNQTLFLDVNLYPYNNNSKIIIYGKIISESLYDQIQKKISNIYGVYPETDYFGVCGINCEDHQKPYIIGCNNYFKNLLEDTNLESSSIISSSAFQNCLTTHSTETGYFVIQNSLMQIKHFKISVTHISEIRNNIFLVTLIPVEQELATIEFSIETLSKREKEILNYVANGLTNRYIAKILNIKEGTVKKTIYNGYKKLGICSRVELVNSLKMSK